MTVGLAWYRSNNCARGINSYETNVTNFRSFKHYTRFQVHLNVSFCFVAAASCFSNLDANVGECISFSLFPSFLHDFRLATLVFFYFASIKRKLTDTKKARKQFFVVGFRERKKERKNRARKKFFI